jgi:hypothetical protein
MTIILICTFPRKVDYCSVWTARFSRALPRASMWEQINHQLVVINQQSHQSAASAAGETVPLFPLLESAMMKTQMLLAPMPNAFAK